MTNRFNRLGVLGLGRNGCWTGRFGKREPIPCRGAVDALRRHLDAQQAWRSKITDAWQEHDLVFCTGGGLPLDPANVRRSFRAVMSRAGLDDQVWTPRELRHSFVSLMSDAGVPLEDISRLVGHRSTIVTESVYRKQLRPVLTQGTEAMDRLFRPPDRSSDRPGWASKTDPWSSS
ncbi:site-specific integrase [Terrabacter sp. 2YAF2]|uniref:site-specific integrase n=1 Tax=Terrabacter sp. 2YAF2 TaxID=3233026 RepID=UPI003F9A3DFA